MRHGGRSSILLVLVATLLVACGSAEDRINEAVPVADAVQAAKVKFDAAVNALPSADRKELEAQYRNQLKVRALECSAGYSPSLFSSSASIRQTIGNSGCFESADQALLQWMGLRRASLLAAMPPLRPMPAGPAGMLVAKDRITRLAVAEAAGVALLQVDNGYELVDIATGQVLGHGGALKGRPVLSPNGRLVASGGGKDARVWDAGSGEELALLADVKVSDVFWVGQRGLLYVAGDRKLTFLDLTSGVALPVPSDVQDVFAVTPTPGQPDTFVVLGNDRAATLKIACDAKACSPRLLQETRLGVASAWSPGAVAVVGNRAFLARARMLHQVDLGSLHTQAITFEPMFLREVVATSDPDKLIIKGDSLGSFGRSSMYLYSVANRTLAKVDTDRLLTNRLSYAPGLRTNLGIDGSKVVTVSDFPAAPPVPMASVINALQFAEQAAKLELEGRLAAVRAARDAAFAGYPRGPSTLVTESGAGPSRSFGSGEAGLNEAVRAGVLRLGNAGDVNAWKTAYTSKTGQSVGRDFDDRIRSMSVYVVTGDMAIPSGLNGAHAVVFVLPRGAPHPRGNAGHSPILDIKSGSCGGPICGMILR